MKIGEGYTLDGNKKRFASGASPWSLRSYLRQSSQYHRGVTASAGSIHHANSIFMKGAEVGSTTITGIVDGHEATFELRENLNSKPMKRQTHTYQSENARGSSLEIRFRWYIMRYSVLQIIILYFVIFLAMNVLFAGLWSIQEGRCCDNPSLTFAQVFDFSVQTLATIGYGGYVPKGFYANFLVVMISLLSMMLNAVYGGLLLLKFIAPSAKIKFSDVITLSNINGVPCLELRVGNEDGSANNLLDLHARLTYSYRTEYIDENGNEQFLAQTHDLVLIHNSHMKLDEIVWTLRHKIDETSPLFGLDFQVFPGNKIFAFDTCINGTQENTGSPVFSQVRYPLDHLLIGHKFVDQVRFDAETSTVTVDHGVFDDTRPHPVWYPCQRTVPSTIPSSSDGMEE